MGSVLVCIPKDSNDSGRISNQPTAGFRVEGAPAASKPLDAYLLDGQQRMTSLYQSTSTRSPVLTQTAKKRPARLHFYFDIKAALNLNVTRRDAIVAVPEDRVIRENFGR